MGFGKITGTPNPDFWMDMTTEEAKAAIVAFNLKGDNNVIFFDTKAISVQQITRIAESCTDSTFDAVFIPVRVPNHRTLRGCVMLRNPITGWITGQWYRLTWWLMEKRNKNIEA